MNINYISYQTLINDSLALAKRLPRKYDLIVGIPKSGMIPAYIIGSQLNTDVLDLDTFLTTYIQDCHNILLVDDSISSGGTMKRALERIKGYNIQPLAIYTDNAENHNVIFSRVIKAPRIFQWNIFKHGHLKTAGIDYDGVLCKNPTIIEDDNKPDEMINHILNAEPLYIPKKPVYAIITNRIEKYRKESEEWLKKYNIQYEKLIMVPFKSANERRSLFHQLGGNGFWKAQKCIELKAAWFIESDITQAKQIKSIIKSSVFCTDKMQMFS